MNTEGIITVGELAEWKNDDWDQWKNNCKNPDTIPDPVNPANLIHQTPFAIPVKSLKRLKAASELIRYYDSVSIELTATKIRWKVIENYKIQRKAIYLRIKQTVPDVPNIGKTTNVVKWKDSIMVYAGQVFEARKSSLKYVIQSNGGLVMPHRTLLLNPP